MTARAMDFGRAALAAFFLLAGPRGVESLLGQQPVPQTVGMSQPAQTNDEPQGGQRMGPNDQISLIQWAVKEGGAFAVILVILFFYRRDWKTAVEFWRDQHAITTKLVQDSTAAQVSMEAALRENTVVVHQAKNVMAKHLPERRDG